MLLIICFPLLTSSQKSKNEPKEVRIYNIMYVCLFVCLTYSESLVVLEYVHVGEL